MSAVLRTQTSGERQGFMKALVGRSDDGILGFTMIGRRGRRGHRRGATEMLPDLPYTGFRGAILAHPVKD
jgi:pyruvate/2-oxoglutarate dehydrogenase complex dihydrolipoamide dehydrogenase (E3) component